MHWNITVLLQKTESVGQKSVHEPPNGARNSVADWRELPAKEGTNTPLTKILEEHYVIKKASTETVFGCKVLEKILFVAANISCSDVLRRSLVEQM